MVALPTGYGKTLPMLLLGHLLPAGTNLINAEISFCQKFQPLSWPLPTLQWNVHGNLQIIYFRSHTTTIWSFISASIIRSLLKKWIKQLKLGRFILGLLANSKLQLSCIFTIYSAGIQLSVSIDYRLMQFLDFVTPNCADRGEIQIYYDSLNDSILRHLCSCWRIF